MKITCPYCYETFDSKDIMLRCSFCPEEEDKVYFNYWGKIDPDHANPMQKHAYNIRYRFVFLKDDSCDVCGGKSKEYICPECHNELESAMVEKGAEIISVIGGPNSGKTHYIISLLFELQKHGYEIVRIFNADTIEDIAFWECLLYKLRKIDNIDNRILVKPFINELQQTIQEKREDMLRIDDNDNYISDDFVLPLFDHKLMQRRLHYGESLNI